MSAVGVAFEIPSVFREVIPGLSTEQAEAEVRARLEVDGGAGPPSGRIARLTTEYARTSALLAATGIRYAATCFGRFRGAWSMGTLTLGLSPLAYRDTAAAVAGMGAVLTEHDSGTEVSTLALPCGPAALAVRRPEPLRISTGASDASGAADPADASGAPGDGAALDVSQLQVFIPVPPDAVPGAQTLATVTFNTPNTDHWADYCALLSPFLRSVRFVPDADAVADGNAPSMSETDTAPGAPADAASGQEVAASPAAERPGASAFG
ncbi:hypothetical protein [Streptomyces sp. NPDC059080]|uniref:hypothetical protein n=1 Tax=Streptomyces sp. NPDC059080 TaxID=3346718 RepID=UPI0036A717A4